MNQKNSLKFEIMARNYKSVLENEMKVFMNKKNELRKLFKILKNLSFSFNEERITYRSIIVYHASESYSTRLQILAFLYFEILEHIDRFSKKELKILQKDFKHDLNNFISLNCEIEDEFFENESAKFIFNRLLLENIMSQQQLDENDKILLVKFIIIRITEKSKEIYKYQEFFSDALEFITTFVSENESKLYKNTEFLHIFLSFGHIFENLVNFESLSKFYQDLLIQNCSYYSYEENFIENFFQIFDQAKNKDENTFIPLFRRFFSRFLVSQKHSLSFEKFMRLKDFTEKFSGKSDLIKLYENIFVSIFDNIENEIDIELLEKFRNIFQEFKIFSKKENSDEEILNKVIDISELIIFPGLLRARNRLQSHKNEHNNLIKIILKFIKFCEIFSNSHSRIKKCLLQR